MCGLNFQQIAVFLAGLLLGYYLPSYLNKKGENLATKEDIGEITKQVESAKVAYSKDLETLRASLSSKLYIHQIRYQNEFEILKDLAGKLVDLKDAALSLRPVVDQIDSKEPNDERRDRRLRCYNEMAEAFYVFYARRKPFYPDAIYLGLNKLFQTIRKEAFDFADAPDRTKHYDRDYWKRASENAEEISRSADEVMDLIRERVKYWEEFKGAA